MDVERLLARSLGASIGSVIEAAIFTGTGTNQPTGLASLTGINSTTYTNGGSPTLANAMKVVEELDTDKVPDVGRAWIANPGIREVMRGVPIILNGNVPSWYRGEFLDYPAYVSPNVTDTGKGNAYLAQWAHCFVGLFSNVEIMVNPFSLDQQGLVRITGWQLADIQFGNVNAFSELKSA